MMTWIRAHLGVVAAAVTVLAVAMATSATAALVITGKDIKNGSVTTKDIKDKSLKTNDLSKAARESLEGAPAFIGSPCTVSTAGPGTVEMDVADNGTVALICALPPETPQDIDADSDGWIRSQECNDFKSAVNPAANEVFGDRFDNDCDGMADDGTDSGDLDGDGQTIASGDCDDTDNTVKAGNADTLGNGIDNDCDGVDG